MHVVHWLNRQDSLPGDARLEVDLAAAENEVLFPRGTAHRPERDRAVDLHLVGNPQLQRCNRHSRKIERRVDPNAAADGVRLASEHQAPAELTRQTLEIRVFDRKNVPGGLWRGGRVDLDVRRGTRVHGVTRGTDRQPARAPNQAHHGNPIDRAGKLHATRRHLNVLGAGIKNTLKNQRSSRRQHEVSPHRPVDLERILQGNPLGSLRAGISDLHLRPGHLGDPLHHLRI